MDQPLRKIWVANIEEDPETGDAILVFPEGMMEEMGWKEGDVLDFDVEGTDIVIRKVG